VSADACREQALSGGCTGKVQSDVPAFHPYWGKTAVRNDMGERRDGGIIRSPFRALFLPGGGGYGATRIPTATGRQYTERDPRSKDRNLALNGQSRIFCFENELEINIQNQRKLPCNQLLKNSRH
jgi:hypothetical protein